MDIIHGNKVIRVAARHASFEAHIRKHFDVYFDSVVPRFLSDGKKLADFSKWKSVPPVPEQLLFNLEDASIHLGRPEVACRK